MLLQITWCETLLLTKVCSYVWFQTSGSFLECFRNNLLDIGINYCPYGTHSFRRGGCQYLSTEKRLNLIGICSWAGWAENFDSPGTVFKYLLSWNDDRVDRSEIFDPDRAPTMRCPRCGRSCNCA